MVLNEFTVSCNGRVVFTSEFSDDIDLVVDGLLSRFPQPHVEVELFDGTTYQVLFDNQPY